MKRAFVVVAALALTAGCASGGGNNSASTAPPVTPTAQSHVSMSFTPAANAKKVVISVDGQKSPALLISNQPQTATLPNNVAVSVDCENVSGGSTSSTGTTTGTGPLCTLLTLLPAGQHDISVAQMDFLNGLIGDLSQFITLADGSSFFGNFFNASPSPMPSTSPAAS